MKGLLRRGEHVETASDFLKRARTVERSKVQKLRHAKQQTNPYHRMQYISAFIESRSAMLTHQNVSRSLYPLLGVNSISFAGTTKKTEFGSWRRSGSQLSASLRAAEMLTHNVVREGTTPPSWSYESIASQCPLHAQMLRDLLHTYFPFSKEGRDASPRPIPFGASNRPFALWDAYKAMLRSVSQDSSTLGETFTAISSTLLQRLTWYDGWKSAISFYTKCLGYLSQYKEEAKIATQLLAVMAEGIRYAHARHGAPPFAVVVEILESTADAISCPTLPPVTAAPVFSILHSPLSSSLIGSDGSSSAVSSTLIALTDRYFLPQGSGKKAQRRYLPSVAWGELLDAAGRCGASQEELQRLVDDLTNPLLTKQKELPQGGELSGDTHIWSAYLRYSSGRHAVDVYEKNRKHYNVKETPKLIAAVIHALVKEEEEEASNLLPLHSSSTTSNISLAQCYWNRLQQLSPRFIIGTSSTCKAYVALCQAKRNSTGREDLLKWMTSYGGFWFFFGVPHDFWESHGGPRLHEESSSLYLRSGGTPFLEFLSLCEAYHPFQIPPSVSVALQRALEVDMARADHAISSRVPQKDATVLTADILTEMLME